MSAAPRKETARSTKSAASATKARGPIRLFVTAGLVCTIVGVGTYLAWQRVAHRVLHQEQYRLTLEAITITETPAWIHADVRQQVVRDAGLDENLWIHDADLAERVAKAFAVHPWVAKVDRVTKRAPARVQVELTYRKPVCMVEVPGGVFPVDIEGVLLPREDFSPAEARRYPRLAGVGTLPAGLVGMPWGDLQVVGGAEIAAELLDDWEAARLDYITVVSAAGKGIVYELVPRTVNGSLPFRIVWGSSPGQPSNEPSPEQKVARLKQFLEEYASGGGTSATEIDLRYASSARTALK